MATTAIIPIHQSKGSTTARCLKDRIDYVTNPEKTNGGELISAYACDPKTAAVEFLISKQEYKQITGRTQENDVILYQVRQSFKPTEITPEEANKIGYEFAERFMKGRHAFIVCTHVDKAHIHNHIEWNSTALDCESKFRNFYNSTEAVRKLSDLICAEHRLSIIKTPQKSAGGYSKAGEEKRRKTNRDMLRSAIDEAMQKQPRSIDELIELLAIEGYTAKRGKHLAFLHKTQKKYLRLDSLGEGYSEAELIRTLADNSVKQRPKTKKTAEHTSAPTLISEIEAKLRSGKGAGYTQWAKVFRLKQMAKTILYLEENGFADFDALSKATDNAESRFSMLKEKIKAAEARMAEIHTLKTHIVNYSKTKSVYIAYRKAGYSKKFLAEHEGDIILHKAAKKAFDDLGVKNLPTVKALNAEFSRLMSEKKAAYADYRRVKTEMRELRIHRANTAYILGNERENRTREAALNEKQAP